MKTTHFCVLIHCSADCWLFPQAICPSPQKIALKTIENNRKISITKEICITIDSPKKVPRRKPDSEAGCIFENFTSKQGNSLKILTAGTRNHGVSLPPPPGGFRKHYSTDTCLSYLTDRLRNGFEKGLLTGMILIDLQKAFDTIDHSILLEKMKCFSFSESTIRWFTSYLSNRSFIVSRANP